MRYFAILVDIDPVRARWRDATPLSQLNLLAYDTGQAWGSMEQAGGPVWRAAMRYTTTNRALMTQSRRLYART
jgi:hypothetical protein